MISADVSCRLLEVDFSGIEAVLTGRQLWAHGIDVDGARQYIRLARLGMHAAVTALKLGRPIDLSQPDDVVKSLLDEVKHGYPLEYDRSKRTVHAKNFGMTVFGQVETFPEYFPTIKVAQEFEDFYYALAPGLPTWHQALRKHARDTGKLGGTTLSPAVPTIWDHPYGYQHWFWDVLNYQPCNDFTARKWLNDVTRKHRIVQLHGRYFKVNFGGDANRVIAYYPQSIAAGRLKEAECYPPDGLFWPESPYYIGDAYFGRTPLLGPIHDSLLLHIPNRCWDRVVEKVAYVMQRPSEYLPIPAEWQMGDYLPIGVSAKAGRNWADAIDEDTQIRIKIQYGVDVPLNTNGMEEIAIPQYVMHAGPDAPVLPTPETQEEEEWRMLQRAIA